ncbi:mandelate racemase/muconate lactonizing enzyme family protein [Oceanisphaera psychrotolerans]|uniref:Mandelate racemase n=1 Tax=Oceanisphaera psychrotolerans TaxID=1414654 RepID=A0A1J4QDS8_9GAMM|nr:mandelate racemase/muconate lactonizing enzyme family protein [Oceanisphaera psychrotolerans]OIN09214.1 mandelate racemase [Oceanisphaera psychrotolerans]
MKESIIKRVEIYAVADHSAAHLPWADNQEPLIHTNNIVRLITEDGLEGVGATISYTENDFDRCILEAMRTIVPGLIGKNALMTEEIHGWLMNRCSWGGLVAKSPIDIAAWDIKGKKAGMPLYMMLGGARHKMLSYASTPMFDTVEEYFPFIDGCIEHGFKAIKLHCYCVYEKDLKLVKAVQARYKDTGIALMLDTATFYNQQEALKMARLLDEYGWAWYEAPVSDYDYATYQRLVKDTNLEISSHGNCLLTLQEVAYALANNMWSDVRQDATVCGGITPLNKCFALAEAHGKNLEIQSWGYTITQAANLHVALAHNNCRFFEQAYPYENFELGAKDVIRTDKDGFVHAPEKPGLGIDMDWDVVRGNAIGHYAFE